MSKLLLSILALISVAATAQDRSIHFETSAVDANGQIISSEVNIETIAISLLANHQTVIHATAVAVRDEAFDAPELEPRQVELELKIIDVYKNQTDLEIMNTTNVAIESDMLIMPGTSVSRYSQRINEGGEGMVSGVIHGQSIYESGQVIKPNTNYIFGLRLYNDKLTLPNERYSLYSESDLYSNLVQWLNTHQ